MAMAKKYMKRALTIVPKLNAADRKWLSLEMRKILLTNTAGAEVVRRGSAAVPVRARQVFISHSHNDKAFVRALARQLESAGIAPWLDEADLNAGDTLVERLQKAVAATPVLIVVLSKASVASPWVKREVRTALLGHGGAPGNIVVIPVLKEHCQVPSFLRGTLAADLTTPYRRTRNLPGVIESVLQSIRSSGSRRSRKRT